jgi:hypothetical protein
MDFVLITTSNVSAGRSEALQRMLGSVRQSVEGQRDRRLTLSLLLQECPSQLTLLGAFPQFVDLSQVPERLSLSTARNILLKRAANRGLIGPDTIVGFPDDDCWYPDGLLDRVAGEFERSPDMDLWFCRYGSRPALAGDGFARRARTREVVRQASSNTMFVRGTVLQPEMLFDEELGVGTAAGSAEDTEFALRVHLLRRQSRYVDRVLIGHRDKNSAIRAKYYQGGLMAIARHARRQRRVTGELCRKIGVGAWLTLRGELSFAGYRSALQAGAKAWRVAR